MYFKLELKNNKYLISNWVIISPILQMSFANVTFNDGFDIQRPKKHTLGEITKKDNTDLFHILVFDSEKEIIGGLFCIPQKKLDDKDFCDLGWFFTSPNLTMRNRLQIVDAIMNTAHKMIKNMGITKIITEMGTKEGEQLMSKKYGYYHSPEENHINRWIKDL